MKISVAAFLIFLTCIANADELPLAPVPAVVPVLALEKGPLQAIRFGGFYSTADAVTGEGTVDIYSASNKEKSTGQFGVLVEDFIPLNEQSSFTFGFTYEFERTVSGYEATIDSVSDAGSYTKKPTFGVINLYGNYGMALTPNAAVYGGIGYSFLKLNNSNLTAKGGLGYQIGFNYEIQQKKFLMLEYRLIKGSADGVVSGLKVNLDKLEFNGLIVGFKASI